MKMNKNMKSIHMVWIKGSVCSELMTQAQRRAIPPAGELASPGAPDRPGRPLLWEHIPAFPDVGLCRQSYCVWFLTPALGHWGGFPWPGLPFPIGFSCLSEERSRKGEKEELWWIATVIATVPESSVTMAIIICKKIPKFAGTADPGSKL